MTNSYIHLSLFPPRTPLKYLQRSTNFLKAKALMHKNKYKRKKEKKQMRDTKIWEDRKLINIWSPTIRCTWENWNLNLKQETIKRQAHSQRGQTNWGTEGFKYLWEWGWGAGLTRKTGWDFRKCNQTSSSPPHHKARYLLSPTTAEKPEVYCVGTDQRMFWFGYIRVRGRMKCCTENKRKKES